MTTRRPRVPRSAMSRAASTVPSGQTEVSPAAEAATDAHPVVGHSAKVIPLDTGAPRQQARPAAPPRPTPEQRRAAERRALLERSVRGSGAPSSGSSAASSSSSSSAAERPAGAGVRQPSAGPSRPAASTRPAGRTARPGTSARPTGGSSRPGPAARTGSAPATHGSTEVIAKALRAQQPQAPVKPIPARSFSGRSIALLVVALVAAILVAPTLRVFLNQQAELTTVTTEIEQERELQGELTAQIKRWEDPAYVQQQARDRLNLVMPGEKKYMVIGGETALPDAQDAPSDPGTVNPEMPWAEGLWDSVVRAATD